MSKRRSQKQEKPTRGDGLLYAITALIAVGAIAAVFIFTRPKPESRVSVAEVAPAKVETNAAPARATNDATGTNLLGNLPALEEDKTDMDKALEHVQKGTELMSKGDAAKAVEEYRLAIQFNPEDEDSYYNLGLALAKLGN